MLIADAFKNCKQTSFVVFLKGTDDLKKHEEIEIVRADVYKMYKESHPCVKGHRQKRTSIITTVVVKLSTGHPLMQNGERLAIRVYPKEGECKLLFRRLTCIPPEFDWALGKEAPRTGKKLGELREKLQEVKKKQENTVYKNCDEAFRKLAFDKIAPWS